MSKINGTKPIQVYLDVVTHKKLKLRALQEGTPMATMICGILVKETFSYDDNGLLIGAGMLPDGMTVADLGLPEDKTLGQKEKEYEEYAAQQEKAKNVVAAFLRPSSKPSDGPLTMGLIARNMSGQGMEQFKCEIFALSSISPVAGQARLITVYGSTYAECEANARLIAAAPELLEALEALPLDQFIDESSLDASTFVDHSRSFLKAMRMARSALAKVKGGV